MHNKNVIDYVCWGLSFYTYSCFDITKIIESPLYANILFIREEVFLM
jgi:hypothetical protein